jgi:DNA-binding MarR family transcriptional regulator
MKTEIHEHFTDTIFYQIELTAKYCKLLGQQVFEKFNLGISLEEYSVLDVLTINEALCQRDIAKIILKDRANTGKLLDSLALKKYITRELAVKNNRPVKLVKITDEGIKKVNEVAEKARPNYNLVKEKINNRNLAKVGDLLKELREILKETIEIQI